jgi:hypothetical protein
LPILRNGCFHFFCRLPLAAVPLVEAVALDPTLKSKRLDKGMHPLQLHV